MVEYKLYILGETGMIARGVWFEAPDDDRAIATSLVEANGAPSELWQKDRLVEAWPGQAAA